jgi:ATP-dependent Lhr-like helicase
MRVVIHSPFGGRVNAPWGMALAHRIREWLGEAASRSADPSIRRSANPLYELQVQTTDDGIMLRLPALAKPLPMDVVRGMTPDEARRRVLEEVGSSSLFGARFRMNAARALLLPRGDPRRRMPLWLQRLKALDLLQSVREHPSFPILVETYRDVLSDAFDMTALEQVLGRIARDELPMHYVETRVGSPFASSLQFGFVMDWLYGDDAPRAEQRAALLSLDRALLDEVLGVEGADAETLGMLDEMLSRRRGTAPGFRARTADELAVLIDRAGDLTKVEIGERIATVEEGRRATADPFAELISSGRVVSLDIPDTGAFERRFVLIENVPRYVSAFGDAILASAHGTIPGGFRAGTLTRDAARTELVGRILAIDGALSIDDIQRRYDIDEHWLRRRLEQWQRHGRVVRGTFGVADGHERWCMRRLIEIARRRELARARKQIQAVDLPAYARFVERWQHAHPDTRIAGDPDSTDAVRQFYGLPRSAEWWTREAVRTRFTASTTEIFSRLASTGELVWVADPPPDSATSRLGTIRVIRRGTGRAWLAPDRELELSEPAQVIRDAIKENGASFFDELMTMTSLPSRRFRDGLRELIAAGLVTSDSFEALRLASRWRSMPRDVDAGAPDPTRWIPVDPDRPRPIVHRRGMVRRLPKWKRPDLDGADPGSWPGRWSLVRTAGILGPKVEEATLAESIGRQWLDRYGIVSREHWKRERPAVPWRSIYLELRRLEMRGDVRRGYFVDGLAGVQFAKTDAIEMLRAKPDENPPVIILSASDPANVQNLQLQPEKRDSFARTRGRGATIATINGLVVLVAESRGKSMRVRPDIPAADITRAAKAMAEHLVRRTARPRDLVVETIDGVTAATSPSYPAFAEAGYRRATKAVRYYARV